GVGTGKNLRYYPIDAKVTAIDFSEKMLKYAKQRAAKIGLDANLKNMDVQALQFESNSFPNVIATFVFCSVPDSVIGLKEIKRVSIPNGRLVLLEHVRPKNPWFGKLFDWFNPIAVKCTGVNINRDTAENIRKAGLEIELEKNLLGNVFKLFVARPRRLTKI
ncbi:MAG: methyltransferase domain-containing protein, partial [bacterium]